MGNNSLVIGQLCLKPSNKTVVKSDLEFVLNVKLPKDPHGMVRRDTMEDKENQVAHLEESAVVLILCFVSL